MHKMRSLFFTLLFLLIFWAPQQLFAFAQGDGEGGSDLVSLHENARIPDPADTDFSEGLTMKLEIPLDSPVKDAVLSSGIKPVEDDAKKDAEIFEVPVSSVEFASMPIAVIGEEPLPLQSYRQALEPTTNDEGKVFTVAGQDPMQVLRRLINTQLIVREGRESGIDLTPEIVDRVNSYANWHLWEMLITQETKDAKPDPEMVETLYRQGATEFRLRMVAFADEADAKEMRAQLDEGRDFDELADELSKQDKAKVKVGGEKSFVKRRDMLPDMATAVDKLEIGQTSPVIESGNSYMVVKLLEKRLLENPQVRAQAVTLATNYASNVKLANYEEALKEKYVTMHQDVVDSLDDIKTADDFQKMLTDDRALADIKGDGQLTVAELADALRVRYFHGLERAMEDGRFAKDRATLLETKLYKRIFRLEAVAQGLDKNPDFVKKVKKYEDTLIFGHYIAKAIVPSIQLSEEELKGYYEDHLADYSTPEMFGLRSLAFYDVDDAQAALDSLQKGTDLRWLQNNMEGQVKPDTAGLLTFDGKLVTASSLPEDMVKLLEEVTPGSYRLYGDDDSKFYYVLFVERKEKATSQPFKNVKESIAKDLFNQKLGESMDDTFNKLREAYGVENYVIGFNKQTL